MSSEKSVPRQTPKGEDTPSSSTEEDDPQPQGGGGSRRPGGMTNEPSGTPIDRPHSEEEDPAVDLHDVEEDDPVERLIEYARRTVVNARKSSAPTHLSGAAVEELAELQKEVVQHIRSGVEDRSLPEAITYLHDVQFEFELADDLRVNGIAIIGDVEEKIEKLKQHLEGKQERQRNISPPSGSPEAESESTPDRWRHLARAAIVLENCPDPDGFGDLKREASERCEQLNVRSPDGSLSEDPWGAIKKGVKRLRKHLTNEDHSPERYCKVDGFKNLVHDLVQGNDVSASGSS